MALRHKVDARTVRPGMNKEDRKKQVKVEVSPIPASEFLEFDTSRKVAHTSDKEKDAEQAAEGRKLKQAMRLVDVLLVKGVITQADLDALDGAGV